MLPSWKQRLITWNGPRYSCGFISSSKSSCSVCFEAALGVAVADVVSHDLLRWRWVLLGRNCKQPQLTQRLTIPLNRNDTPWKINILKPKKMEVLVPIMFLFNWLISFLRLNKASYFPGCIPFQCAFFKVPVMGVQEFGRTRKLSSLASLLTLYQWSIFACAWRHEEVTYRKLSCYPPKSAIQTVENIILSHSWSTSIERRKKKQTNLLQTGRLLLVSLGIRCFFHMFFSLFFGPPKKWMLSRWPPNLGSKSRRDSGDAPAWPFPSRDVPVSNVFTSRKCIAANRSPDRPVNGPPVNGVV